VAVAGVYFLLQAQFIAFLQIIVYAGAIMVLILFVIMLLAVRDEGSRRPAGLFQRTLGGAAAALFAGLVVSAVIGSSTGGRFPEPPAGFGTVSELGLQLFRRYYYAFEAVSLLLVVAMIGAVLLAKRRL
jgi:NADH-quinone oxidoreductase subunit J